MSKRKTPPPGKGRRKTQRQMFVEEYLVSLNHIDAAQRSGWGRTRAASKMAGERLMKEPEIRAAIDAALSARKERLKLNGDDYLRVLHDLCTFDPSSMFDDNGRPLPLRLMPESARRAVSSVQTIIGNASAGDGVTDLVLSLRFINRRDSVELMLKHLGLLIDRKETGKPGQFAHLQTDQKIAKLEQLMAQIREKREARGVPVNSRPH